MAHSFVQCITNRCFGTLSLSRKLLLDCCIKDYWCLFTGAKMWHWVWINHSFSSYWRKAKLSHKMATFPDLFRAPIKQRNGNEIKSFFWREWLDDTDALLKLPNANKVSEESQLSLPSLLSSLVLPLMLSVLLSLSLLLPLLLSVLLLSQPSLLLPLTLSVLLSLPLLQPLLLSALLSSLLHLENVPFVAKFASQWHKRTSSHSLEILQRYSFLTRLSRLLDFHFDSDSWSDDNAPNDMTPTDQRLTTLNRDLWYSSFFHLFI